MAPRSKDSVIDRLVAEILATLSESERRGLSELAAAGEEIRALARLDYQSLLRKCLHRGEAKQVLAEAKAEIWPHWNRVPARVGSIREFVKTYSSLGVDVRPTRFSEPEGFALLGFYLGRRKGLSKRPMICVNIAHHPAIVGAAFIHEMGHHLVQEMFGTLRDPARFLLYTGYADHLKDQAELAPDLLVSVGALPADTARRIFGAARDGKRIGGPNQELANASSQEMLKYFRIRYGLDFTANLSARGKLQYLAALIHYTKLRQALMDEYDV